MKFIPTKIHGLLDYLMALALIFSPWYFWTTENGADFWIPLLMGTAMIIYSVCTDYEWGAFHSLSMNTHLLLDMLGGLLLAVSPWMFGFADLVYLPHVLFGVTEIIAALLTQTEPSRKGSLGPSTL